jgi:uncharacterized protein
VSAARRDHTDSRVREGPLHVLVMAKAPVAGRVKTRLCPPCTPAEAAAIAEAALADTLAAVVACQGERKVVALDGMPGPWLPPGIEVIAQRGAGLDQRLAHAWADLVPAGHRHAWGIQIGMDTPQVTADLLDDQLAALAAPVTAGGRDRAVLGAAVDGGWWLIGLPGCHPRKAFWGVPMSTPYTGAAQEQRLRSLGLDVVTAPELVDVDDAEDLRRVVETIPGSRTAVASSAVLARMGVTRCARSVA